MTNEKDDKDKKKSPKLLDHEFDGIKELDNPVPIWFQFIFYGTIVFGAIYMLYYHIYKGGHSLKNEYLASVGQTPSKEGGSGEFDYSQNLTNKNMIDSGKQVYDANCASCHGLKGQGGVGPNLTDDFWIVENTYKGVENAIQVGVPEKGMPGWKTILGDKKIQALVVYIASLQGTNPPDAKKPEGKPGKLH
jgi:cytochrome c oxidase cbb3-type subunit 3